MTHELIPKVCTPEEFLAATPNERLNLVLRQIDMTPDNWDQDWWVEENEEANLGEWAKPPAERNLCGTTFCLAGWACVLAGERFTTLASVAGPVGPFKQIPDRAQELLGLKTRDLFDASHDRADLDSLIAEHLEYGNH